MATPRGFSGMDLPEGPENWRQNAIMLMAGLALLAYGAFEAWKPTIRSLGPIFGIVLAVAGAVLLLFAWRRIKSLTAGPKPKEASTAPPESPKPSPSQRSEYKWERRVEVIPRLLVARGRTPKEYAAVLTDQRTILVYRGGGGPFGKVAGPKGPDPWNEEPQALASLKDSIVIPHTSLRKLGIRKGEKGVFRLELRHEPEGRIAETIEATLLPPQQAFDDGKKKGLSRDDVTQQYVEAARAALQKSIPSSR
ncbi:MAG TPA: hypothetical protein VI893_08980 [Thermoplasmata archaeon]|nr:hypothetical protein [Thermoplasmata archaeon]